MKHILLIEDDPWQREHISMVLEQQSWRVTSCAHALEAIELIDANRPDVLLLDMMLPGVNAMTLLHELQSHSDLATIPVVLMTAHQAKALSEKEIAAYGVVSVLDKTQMTLEDIVAAIRKAS